MLPIDKPKYVRLSTPLGDVDIMRAWYVKQNFSKHSHEGYGLGAILSGAMEFSYRGEKLIAHKGCVNSVNPDEPHDGHSFDESCGWCYSMLYFTEDVFRNMYNDMTDKYRTPFLSCGVVHDISFAENITSAVSNILSGKADRLYAESELIKIFSDAIKKHTDKSPADKSYRMGLKMRRVEEYIRSNLHRQISISELSELAGMSPYHFIRSFRRDRGLAPYEFLSVKRAEQAKELILSGARFADAASSCGFTDQSHMNRWLKRIIGVTPKNMSSIVL